MLGKRKRKGDLEGMNDFFKDEDIEEVPADDPATRKERNGYDSDDSDFVAETRILARKLLRKKDRDRMIEDSYNRFTTYDNEPLPTWFEADEQKHNRPFVNATKEEIAIEKEAIKAYNTRPSKKVEEAKARKRKRLSKAMNKIKGKATVIADSDLNEASKMKSIQKLYKKEKAKQKTETKYVVNRTFNTSGKLNQVKGTKMVDARMKKD